MKESAKRIIQGLEEALAHAQRKDVPGIAVNAPSGVDSATTEPDHGPSKVSSDTVPVLD